jgi:hypothetical protein
LRIPEVHRQLQLARSCGCLGLSSGLKAYLLVHDALLNRRLGTRRKQGDHRLPYSGHIRRQVLQTLDVSSLYR